MYFVFPSFMLKPIFCVPFSSFLKASFNSLVYFYLWDSQQNIVQNQNIVIENLSYEQVEKFKYLGVTVININDIHEEIKRRINLGKACYYSLEKILSSHLLSKKLKVNITGYIVWLWNLVSRLERGAQVKDVWD